MVWYLGYYMVSLIWCKSNTELPQSQNESNSICIKLIISHKVVINVLNFLNNCMSSEQEIDRILFELR